MPKYVVKIEQVSDSFYWDSDDWKYNVCADFDENIVLVGRNFGTSIEEASWWQDVDTLLEDIRYGEDAESFIRYHDEYAEDKMQEFYDMYREWDGNNEPAFRAKVAMMLYPGLDLTVSTIRGFSQGDWEEVVYVTDAVDEGILEDWFFGNVYEVYLYELSDESIAEIESSGEYDFDDDIKDIMYDYYGTSSEIDQVTISYTELRNIQRDYGTQEQGFIKYFNLPEDADITIIED